MISIRSTRKAQEDEGHLPRGYDDFDVTLGDVMRGERATMGKSLMDVQRELRIKAAYVAAVEDADPSVFDTPGFIAGYVRSYAKYLNIDPEWAFDKFCAESGFATVHGMSEQALPARMSREDRLAATGAARVDPLERSATPFVPPKESLWMKFNAKAIGSSMILVMLMTGLAYGAYNVVQEVQQVQVAPVELPPMVDSDLDPLAPRTSGVEQTAAVNTPGQDALDRLYRPTALEAPILEPRDGPIASLNPNAQGAFAAPTIETAALLPEVEVAGDTAALSLGAPPVQVVEEAPKELALFAMQGVWLRVRAADGSVILEKIMDKGERFVLPTTEEPAVIERAGNSGSLFFQVNGDVYGPAGQGTKIAKGVVLAEDAVKERYTPIDGSVQSDEMKSLVAQFAVPAATEEIQ